MQIFSLVLITSATLISSNPLSQYKPDTKTLQTCLASKGVPASFPSSPDFSQLAEPYNLRLVYTPAAIVLPTTNQQVADAVLCAGENNVKVQAKSGGHSYASFSSGGQEGSMVIDLENFQDIKVDSNGMANIGAGVRLGDMALSLYNQSGRALPHGTCPGIGLGGHASHGGYGYASRQWGLTLDTVTRCDVILANGSHVYTSPSPDDYPDIHYALLGAAESFGIIMSFEMQTQPAPSSVVNWAFTIPGMYVSASTTAAVFQHIQTFALNTSVIDGKLAFGVHLDGSSFGISGTYLGDEAVFNETIAPALLSGLPTPASTSIQSLDWISSLTLLAAPQPLEQPTTTYKLHDDFFAKSVVVPSSSPLTTEALESYFGYIIENGVNAPDPWFTIINLYGGPGSAINAIPSTASAYSDRSALWVLQHYGFTANTISPYPAASLDFVDGLNTALTSAMPDTQFGAYLNYVDPSLSAAEAHELYYGEETYEKLVGIKNLVDPQHTFWNPQSIGN